MDTVTAATRAGNANNSGGVPSTVTRRLARWCIRAPLAVAAAIAAYVAVLQDIAYVIRKDDAATAHILSPHDGRISALWAQDLTQPGADPGDSGLANRVASSALLQDPTVVSAVTTLGLSADRRSDHRTAHYALRFAQKLSRRDFRTQIWAVQTAVARGDVRGAIANYDIALRTSDEAANLMFPVLASAITRPEVRLALAIDLRTKPTWTGTFIDYLVANNSSPDVVARFFEILDAEDVPVSASARGLLIDALLSRNLLENAWRQYTRLNPTAQRNTLRDLHRPVAGSSALDWTGFGGADLSTSFESAGGGYVFSFATRAGFDGPMLRRFSLLPPGRYTLRGQSSGSSSTPRAYWLLACRGGRELGRIELSTSFKGEFVVPDGCPAQSLTLIARTSGPAGDVSGLVKSVELDPAN